jgi:hypothetical protein
MIAGKRLPLFCKNGPVFAVATMNSVTMSASFELPGPYFNALAETLENGDETSHAFVHAWEAARPGIDCKIENMILHRRTG